MSPSLVFIVMLGVGQGTKDEQKMLLAAREEARGVARAFQDDDYAKLADLTYARGSAKPLTRSQLVHAWRMKASSFRNQGLRLQSYQVEPAKSLVKVGAEYLCVVPTTLKFQAVEGPASLKAYLLAFSHDQGKTWQFVDAADKDAYAKAWLAQGFSLPAVGSVRVDSEEARRAVFSSTAGNLKVSCPDRWQKGMSQAKNMALALERGDDSILFYVEPSDMTLEDLVNFFQNPRAPPAPRRLFGQKDMTVAGEKASFFRFNQANDQELIQFYVSVFNHQGLSYRVIGIRRIGEVKEFEADFQSILERFAFLNDRRDWLRQHEGVPTATAMLGGLVRFELPRPRWTENTFSAQQPGGAWLDYAEFRYGTATGWLHVILYEAQGDLAAEAQAVAASYLPRYPKATIKPATFTAGAGKWTGWELNGVIDGQPCTVWMTCAVNEGIAAWLVLDINRSQVDELRQDWLQFLESFRLQPLSKPEQPLAFPVHRNQSAPKGNRRVADVLRHGKQVYANVMGNQVIQFTADGKKALLQVGGYVLEDLATKQRTAVSIPGKAPSALVLSPDSRWIAAQTDNEITIYPMAFGFSRKIAGQGTHLAFGAGNKDLLVITSSHGKTPRFGLTVGNLFATSKLMRLPLDNGPHQAILDWPLIRASAFAVAPDGKQLAVAANRDYPRTQQFGGYLYVCKPDGSDLRLVNKDPAEYRNLVWSADGKWLYALRRILNANNGDMTFGADFDVERIAPDTGAALNLTRCGKINYLWTGGSDIFLEFRDGTLPSSQQGVFRFNPDVLAKAAPPAPIRRADAGTAARLAGRLEKVLAGVPVHQHVPTAKSLELLAKEFAAAMKDEFEVPLDGSLESLERLPRLIEQLALTTGKHPVNVLGAGSYYGETLRGLLGAQWHIKPVPFGEWMPNQNPPGNAVAEFVFPFSDVYRWGMFDGNLINSYGVANRTRGQDWLLIYPPSHVEAVKKSAARDYLKARALMDKGKIPEALAILETEMKKRPHNSQLARETIALCQSVRQPERAQAVTRRAVEAGVDAQDLLVLYADSLLRTDLPKALTVYRKAAHAPYSSPDTLMKMGRAYDQAGQRPLAESCWRRAYLPASDLERTEIQRLMGITSAQTGLPATTNQPFNLFNPMRR